MFKSILPSRRLPATEFTMVTTLGDSAVNGKENYPALATTTNITKPRAEKHKKSKSTKDVKDNAPDMEQAFTQLLDELQIPPTIRPKLAGMEPSVKAAMLKSSQVITLKGPSSSSPPRTPKGLRKARSSESLSSPRQQVSPAHDDSDLFRSPNATGNSFEAALVGFSNGQSFVSAGHARGKSLDLRRDVLANQSMVSLVAPSGKPTKAKAGKDTTSPARYCNILLGSSSTQLDVEVVKKLRIMLRNEPASWTLEFVNAGGYSALLTRLNELLEVEWREEQHDDQMLHELLRCFKALSTSNVGCNALRSCAPTPYGQLVTLLYSDKKPGDVATRQLIIELLLILFDLYPPSSLPALSSPRPGFHVHARSSPVPWDDDPASSNIITLPAPHSTLFSFIRSLLLTPAPPPSEDPRTPISPHPFIEELHLPRIYKTYLQELNDLCRDYFWVFCHPNNTIWKLEETDEGKVERPRAPGGMTGGVEFEAMSYMTLHFKFLNAIAKAAQDLNLPKEHELSPHRLHSDLFMSGIDRILLVARKASTMYYPTLHLEIARYVKAVDRAGYELPYIVARVVGPPPSAMRKSGSASRGRSPAQSQAGSPGSPTKRSTFVGTPPVQLPTPRKVTPMFGIGS
ncbi:hypothetical protein K474DRAFT_1313687 [Panus rudis PR-1116 ss-1]|nr:hypothetical protein K474DRAFT_1313687 [Panus rudis PR-1116 ss-1]